MLIRIATQDVESAKSLVSALVRLFGGEDVSLQPDGEIHVELNGRSGQSAMADTFASVERWLEETGIGSTAVSVDGRRYRMERPQRLSEQRELGEEPVHFLGGVVVDDPDPQGALG